jgi:hypothetical protein
MMEEATGDLRSHLLHLTTLVEGLRKLLLGQMETTNEHLETLTCSSRYNTEQAIVIRALMQLYIFDVYHQLEMQCGLDPALTGQVFRERVGEFRWDAGNEMARIMEGSAESKNQSAAEQLIEKLYRHLIKPLPEEAREPRW